MADPYFDFGVLIGRWGTPIFCVWGLVHAFPGLRPPRRRASIALALSCSSVLVGIGVRALIPTSFGGLLVAIQVLVILANAAAVVIAATAMRASARARSRGWGDVVLAITVGAFVTIVDGYLLLRPRKVDDGHVANPEPPGTLRRFGALNFAFRTPALPWEQVRAELLNDRASIAFRYPTPELFAVVLVDPGAPGDEPRTVAEMEKATLSHGASKTEMRWEKPLNVHGLRGFAFCLDGTFGSREASFLVWVHVDGTRRYTIALWGKKSDAATLEREGTSLLESFDVLVATPAPSQTTSADPRD